MAAALATKWTADADALPTGSTCTMTHVSVYLVGGQGNWNGTNCWTLSVDALGADLAPITHLASGGIVGAGPAVLQLAIAEEVQALDPSVTPYVGASLQCVGYPPALLAATGTVALLSDDAEPETLAALRSVVQTPLDTDAASLALPLAAGHAFRLAEATVDVTGAAGDWGSANRWLLAAGISGRQLGSDGDARLLAQAAHGARLWLAQLANRLAVAPHGPCVGAVLRGLRKLCTWTTGNRPIWTRSV